MSAAAAQLQLYIVLNTEIGYDAVFSYGGGGSGGVKMIAISYGVSVKASSDKGKTWYNKPNSVLIDSTDACIVGNKLYVINATRTECYCYNLLTDTIESRHEFAYKKGLYKKIRVDKDSGDLYCHSNETGILVLVDNGSSEGEGESIITQKVQYSKLSNCVYADSVIAVSSEDTTITLVCRDGSDLYFTSGLILYKTTNLPTASLPSTRVSITTLINHPNTTTILKTSNEKKYNYVNVVDGTLWVLGYGGLIKYYDTSSSKFKNINTTDPFYRSWTNMIIVAPSLFILLGSSCLGILAHPDANAAVYNVILSTASEYSNEKTNSSTVVAGGTGATTSTATSTTNSTSVLVTRDPETGKVISVETVLTTTNSTGGGGGSSGGVAGGTAGTATSAGTADNATNADKADKAKTAEVSKALLLGDYAENLDPGTSYFISSDNDKNFYDTSAIYDDTEQPDYIPTVNDNTKYDLIDDALMNNPSMKIRYRGEGIAFMNAAGDRTLVLDDEGKLTTRGTVTTKGLTFFNEEAEHNQIKIGNAVAMTVGVVDTVINNISIVGLKNRVDAHDVDLTDMGDRMTEEVSTLNTRIDTEVEDLNTTITNLETTLNETITTLDTTVNATITALDTTVNARITSEVEDLNTTITALDTTVNARIDTEVVDLNTTITALDTTVNARIDTEVVDLTSKVDTLDTTVNATIVALDTTVNNRITSEVADLNTTITALDTTVNATIVALDTTVNNRITSEVSDLNTTITALDTTVNATIVALDTTVNNRITSEVADLNTTITTLDTTVNATIVALDTTVNNRITSEVADLNTSLTALDTTVNATIVSLDTTVNNRITAEVIGLNTTITTLDTNVNARIDTEVEDLNTTITALDTTVNARIDTVVSDVDTRMDTLETSIVTATAALTIGISAVDSRLTDIDTALRTSIEESSNQGASNETAINDINQNLATEITARQTADTTLTTNLSNEITARQTADTTLTTKIDQEILDRQAGDTTLTTNLATETTARQTADTTLTTKINQEILDRQAGDTAISTRMNIFDITKGTPSNTLDVNANTNITGTFTINGEAIADGLKDLLVGRQIDPSVGAFDFTITGDVESITATAGDRIAMNTIAPSAASYDTASTLEVMPDGRIALLPYNNFFRQDNGSYYPNVIFNTSTVGGSKTYIRAPYFSEIPLETDRRSIGSLTRRGRDVIWINDKMYAFVNLAACKNNQSYPVARVCGGEWNGSTWSPLITYETFNKTDKTRTFNTAIQISPTAILVSGVGNLNYIMNQEWEFTFYILDTTTRVFRGVDDSYGEPLNGGGGFTVVSLSEAANKTCFYALCRTVDGPQYYGFGIMRSNDRSCNSWTITAREVRVMLYGYPTIELMGIPSLGMNRNHFQFPGTDIIVIYYANRTYAINVKLGVVSNHPCIDPSGIYWGPSAIPLVFNGYTPTAIYSVSYLPVFNTVVLSTDLYNWYSLDHGRTFSIIPNSKTGNYNTVVSVPNMNIFSAEKEYSASTYANTFKFNYVPRINYRAEDTLGLSLFTISNAANINNLAINDGLLRLKGTTPAIMDRSDNRRIEITDAAVLIDGQNVSSHDARIVELETSMNTYTSLIEPSEEEEEPLITIKTNTVVEGDLTVTGNVTFQQELLQAYLIGRDNTDDIVISDTTTTEDLSGTFDNGSTSLLVNTATVSSLLGTTASSLQMSKGGRLISSGYLSASYDTSNGTAVIPPPTVAFNPTPMVSKPFAGRYIESLDSHLFMWTTTTARASSTSAVGCLYSYTTGLWSLIMTTNWNNLSWTFSPHAIYVSKDKTTLIATTNATSATSYSSCVVDLTTMTAVMSKGITDALPKLTTVAAVVYAYVDDVDVTKMYAFATYSSMLYAWFTSVDKGTTWTCYKFDRSIVLYADRGNTLTFSASATAGVVIDNFVVLYGLGSVNAALVATATFDFVTGSPAFHPLIDPTGMTYPANTAIPVICSNVSGDFKNLIYSKRYKAFFVYNSYGILFSTDKGRTFTLVKNVSTVTQMHFDPSTARLTYVDSTNVVQYIFRKVTKMADQIREDRLAKYTISKVGNLDSLAINDGQLNLLGVNPTIQVNSIDVIIPGLETTLINDVDIVNIKERVEILEQVVDPDLSIRLNSDGLGLEVNDVSSDVNIVFDSNFAVYKKDVSNGNIKVIETDGSLTKIKGDLEVEGAIVDGNEKMVRYLIGRDNNVDQDLKSMMIGDVKSVAVSSTNSTLSSSTGFLYPVKSGRFISIGGATNTFVAVSLSTSSTISSTFSSIAAMPSIGVASTSIDLPRASYQCCWDNVNEKFYYAPKITTATAGVVSLLEYSIFTNTWKTFSVDDGSGNNNNNTVLVENIGGDRILLIRANGSVSSLNVVDNSVINMPSPLYLALGKISSTAFAVSRPYHDKTNNMLHFLVSYGTIYHAVIKVNAATLVVDSVLVKDVVVKDVNASIVNVNAVNSILVNNNSSNSDNNTFVLYTGGYTFAVDVNTGAVVFHPLLDPSGFNYGLSPIQTINFPTSSGGAPEVEIRYSPLLRTLFACVPYVGATANYVWWSADHGLTFTALNQASTSSFSWNEEDSVLTLARQLGNGGNMTQLQFNYNVRLAYDSSNTMGISKFTITQTGNVGDLNMTGDLNLMGNSSAEIKHKNIPKIEFLDDETKVEGVAISNLNTRVEHLETLHDSDDVVINYVNSFNVTTSNDENVISTDETKLIVHRDLHVEGQISSDQGDLITYLVGPYQNDKSDMRTAAEVSSANNGTGALYTSFLTSYVASIYSTFSVGKNGKIVITNNMYGAASRDSMVSTGVSLTANAWTRVTVPSTSILDSAISSGVAVQSNSNNVYLKNREISVFAISTGVRTTATPEIAAVYNWDTSAWSYMTFTTFSLSGMTSVFYGAYALSDDMVAILGRNDGSAAAIKSNFVLDININKCIDVSAAIITALPKLSSIAFSVGTPIKSLDGTHYRFVVSYGSSFYCMMKSTDLTFGTFELVGTYDRTVNYYGSASGILVAAGTSHMFTGKTNTAYHKATNTLIAYVKTTLSVLYCVSLDAETGDQVYNPIADPTGNVYGKKAINTTMSNAYYGVAPVFSNKLGIMVFQMNDTTNGTTGVTTWWSRDSITPVDFGVASGVVNGKWDEVLLMLTSINTVSGGSYNSWQSTFNYISKPVWDTAKTFGMANFTVSQIGNVDSLAINDGILNLKGSTTPSIQVNSVEVIKPGVTTTIINDIDIVALETRVDVLEGPTKTYHDGETYAIKHENENVFTIDNEGTTTIMNDLVVNGNLISGQNTMMNYIINREKGVNEYDMKTQYEISAGVTNLGTIASPTTGDYSSFTLGKNGRLMNVSSIFGPSGSSRQATISGGPIVTNGFTLIPLMNITFNGTSTYSGGHYSHYEPTTDRTYVAARGLFYVRTPSQRAIGAYLNHTSDTWTVVNLKDSPDTKTINCKQGCFRIKDFLFFVGNFVGVMNIKTETEVTIVIEPGTLTSAYSRPCLIGDDRVYFVEISSTGFEYSVHYVDLTTLTKTTVINSKVALKSGATLSNFPFVDVGIQYDTKYWLCYNVGYSAAIDLTTGALVTHPISDPTGNAYGVKAAYLGHTTAIVTSSCEWSDKYRTVITIDAVGIVRYSTNHGLTVDQSFQPAVASSAHCRAFWNEVDELIVIILYNGYNVYSYNFNKTGARVVYDATNTLGISKFNVTPVGHMEGINLVSDSATISTNNVPKIEFLDEGTTVDGVNVVDLSDRVVHLETLHDADDVVIDYSNSFSVTKQGGVTPVITTDEITNKLIVNRDLHVEGNITDSHGNLVSYLIGEDIKANPVIKTKGDVIASKFITNAYNTDMSAFSSGGSYPTLQLGKNGRTMIIGYGNTLGSVRTTSDSSINSAKTSTNFSALTTGLGVSTNTYIDSTIYVKSQDVTIHTFMATARPAGNTVIGASFNWSTGIWSAINCPGISSGQLGVYPHQLYAINDRYVLSGGRTSLSTYYDWFVIDAMTNTAYSIRDKIMNALPKLTQYVSFLYPPIVKPGTTEVYFTVSYNNSNHAFFKSDDFIFSNITLIKYDVTIPIFGTSTYVSESTSMVEVLSFVHEVTNKLVMYTPTKRTFALDLFKGEITNHPIIDPTGLLYGNTATAAGMFPSLPDLGVVRYSPTLNIVMAAQRTDGVPAYYAYYSLDGGITNTVVNASSSIYYCSVILWDEENLKGTFAGANNAAGSGGSGVYQATFDFKTRVIADTSNTFGFSKFTVTQAGNVNSLAINDGVINLKNSTSSSIQVNGLPKITFLDTDDTVNVSSLQDRVKTVEDKLSGESVELEYDTSFIIKNGESTTMTMDNTNKTTFEGDVVINGSLLSGQQMLIDRLITRDNEPSYDIQMAYDIASATTTSVTSFTATSGNMSSMRLSRSNRYLGVTGIFGNSRNSPTLSYSSNLAGGGAPTIAIPPVGNFTVGLLNGRDAYYDTVLDSTFVAIECTSVRSSAANREMVGIYSHLADSWTYSNVATSITTGLRYSVENITKIGGGTLLVTGTHISIINLATPSVITIVDTHANPNSANSQFSKPLVFEGYVYVLEVTGDNSSYSVKRAALTDLTTWTYVPGVSKNRVIIRSDGNNYTITHKNGFQYKKTSIWICYEANNTVAIDLTTGLVAPHPINDPTGNMYGQRSIAVTGLVNTTVTEVVWSEKMNTPFVCQAGYFNYSLNHGMTFVSSTTNAPRGLVWNETDKTLIVVTSTSGGYHSNVVFTYGDLRAVYDQSNTMGISKFNVTDKSNLSHVNLTGATPSVQINGVDLITKVNNVTSIQVDKINGVNVTDLVGRVGQLESSQNADDVIIDYKNSFAITKEGANVVHSDDSTNKMIVDRNLHVTGSITTDSGDLTTYLIGRDAGPAPAPSPVEIKGDVTGTVSGSTAGTMDLIGYDNTSTYLNNLQLGKNGRLMVFGYGLIGNNSTTNGSIPVRCSTGASINNWGTLATMSTYGLTIYTYSESVVTSIYMKTQDKSIYVPRVNTRPANNKVVGMSYDWVTDVWTSITCNEASVVNTSINGSAVYDIDGRYALVGGYQTSTISYNIYFVIDSKMNTAIDLQFRLITLLPKLTTSGTMQLLQPIVAKTGEVYIMVAYLSMYAIFKATNSSFTTITLQDYDMPMPYRYNSTTAQISALYNNSYLRSFIHPDTNTLIIYDASSTCAIDLISGKSIAHPLIDPTGAIYGLSAAPHSLGNICVMQYSRKLNTIIYSYASSQSFPQYSINGSNVTGTITPSSTTPYYSHRIIWNEENLVATCWSFSMSAASSGTSYGYMTYQTSFNYNPRIVKVINDPVFETLEYSKFTVTQVGNVNSLAINDGVLNLKNSTPSINVNGVPKITFLDTDDVVNVSNLQDRVEVVESKLSDEDLELNYSNSFTIKNGDDEAIVTIDNTNKTTIEGDVVINGSLMSGQQMLIDRLITRDNEASYDITMAYDLSSIVITNVTNYTVPSTSSIYMWIFLAKDGRYMGLCNTFGGSSSRYVPKISYTSDLAAGFMDLPMVPVGGFSTSVIYGASCLHYHESADVSLIGIDAGSARISTSNNEALAIYNHLSNAWSYMTINAAYNVNGKIVLFDNITRIGDTKFLMTGTHIAVADVATYQTCTIVDTHATPTVYTNRFSIPIVYKDFVYVVEVTPSAFSYSVKKASVDNLTVWTYVIKDKTVMRYDAVANYPIKNIGFQYKKTSLWLSYELNASVAIDVTTGLVAPHPINDPTGMGYSPTYAVVLPGLPASTVYSVQWSEKLNTVFIGMYGNNTLYYSNNHGLSFIGYGWTGVYRIIWDEKNLTMVLSIAGSGLYFGKVVMNYAGARAVYDQTNTMGISRFNVTDKANMSKLVLVGDEPLIKMSGHDIATKSQIQDKIVDLNDVGKINDVDFTEMDTRLQNIESTQNATDVLIKYDNTFALKQGTTSVITTNATDNKVIVNRDLHVTGNLTTGQGDIVKYLIGENVDKPVTAKSYRGTLSTTVSLGANQTTTTLSGWGTNLNYPVPILAKDGRLMCFNFGSTNNQVRVTANAMLNSSLTTLTHPTYGLTIPNYAAMGGHALHMKELDKTVHIFTVTARPAGVYTIGVSYDWATGSWSPIDCPSIDTTYINNSIVRIFKINERYCFAGGYNSTSAKMGYIIDMQTLIAYDVRGKMATLYPAILSGSVFYIMEAVLDRGILYFMLNMNGSLAYFKGSIAEVCKPPNTSGMTMVSYDNYVPIFNSTSTLSVWENGSSFASFYHEDSKTIVIYSSTTAHTFAVDPINARIANHPIIDPTGSMYGPKAIPHALSPVSYACYSRFLNVVMVTATGSSWLRMSIDGITTYLYPRTDNTNFYTRSLVWDEDNLRITSFSDNTAGTTTNCYSYQAVLNFTDMRFVQSERQLVGFSKFTVTDLANVNTLTVNSGELLLKGSTPAIKLNGEPKITFLDTDESVNVYGLKQRIDVLEGSANTAFNYSTEMTMNLNGDAVPVIKLDDTKTVTIDKDLVVNGMITSGQQRMFDYLISRDEQPSYYMRTQNELASITSASASAFTTTMADMVVFVTKNNRYISLGGVFGTAKNTPRMSYTNNYINGVYSIASTPVLSYSTTEATGGDCYYDAQSDLSIVPILYDATKTSSTDVCALYNHSLNTWSLSNASVASTYSSFSSIMKLDSSRYVIAGTHLGVMSRANMFATVQIIRTHPVTPMTTTNRYVKPVVIGEYLYALEMNGAPTYLYSVIRAPLSDLTTWTYVKKDQMIQRFDSTTLYAISHKNGFMYDALTDKPTVFISYETGYTAAIDMLTGLVSAHPIMDPTGNLFLGQRAAAATGTSATDYRSVIWSKKLNTVFLLNTSNVLYYSLNHGLTFLTLSTIGNASKLVLNENSSATTAPPMIVTMSTSGVNMTTVSFTYGDSRAVYDGTNTMGISKFTLTDKANMNQLNLVGSSPGVQFNGETVLSKTAGGAVNIGGTDMSVLNSSVQANTDLLSTMFGTGASSVNSKWVYNPTTNVSTVNTDLVVTGTITTDQDLYKGQLIGRKTNQSTAVNTLYDITGAPVMTASVVGTTFPNFEAAYNNSSSIVLLYDGTLLINTRGFGSSANGLTNYQQTSPHSLSYVNRSPVIVSGSNTTTNNAVGISGSLSFIQSSRLNYIDTVRNRQILFFRDIYARLSDHRDIAVIYKSDTPTVFTKITHDATITPTLLAQHSIHKLSDDKLVLLSETVLLMVNLLTDTSTFIALPTSTLLPSDFKIIAMYTDVTDGTHRILYVNGSYFYGVLKCDNDFTNWSKIATDRTITAFADKISLVQLSSLSPSHFKYKHKYVIGYTNGYTFCIDISTGDIAYHPLVDPSGILYGQYASATAILGSATYVIFSHKSKLIIGRNQPDARMVYSIDGGVTKTYFGSSAYDYSYGVAWDEDKHVLNVSPYINTTSYYFSKFTFNFQSRIFYDTTVPNDRFAEYTISDAANLDSIALNQGIVNLKGSSTPSIQLNGVEVIKPGALTTVINGVDVVGIKNRVEGLETTTLLKASNLSDLTNIPSARTNLDVYSKAEADNIIPAGNITFSARTATPPTGWLICDGSTISRVTYSRLFTAIGTTYGVGDGTTTFTLPDLTSSTSAMFSGIAMLTIIKW